MTRPPPLQLVPMDTYVPDVPQSWIVRLLKTLNDLKWKRVVIAVTILSALRFGIQANTSFIDMNIDASQNLFNLATISLAEGLMYAVATLIQILGFFSAILERLPLLRAYTFLSFLVALLVSAASIMDLVVFFKFVVRDELMKECASLAMVGLVPTKSTFSGEFWPSGKIDSRPPANDQCLTAWDAAASLRPVSFVLLNFLPAIIVFLAPYMYYRQLTNVSHPHAGPMAPYSPLYNSTTSAAGAGVVAAAAATRGASPVVSSLCSAPVTVTLHGYHPTTLGSASPGPPSFKASHCGMYPTYDPGLSAYSGQSEHGEFV